MCRRICLQRDKRSKVTGLHADSVTLSNRRNILCCNLVYCGLGGKLTPVINQMFVHISGNHDRNTRASNTLMLAVTKCKLNISKSNLRLMRACYYNNFPLETKKNQHHKFRKSPKETVLLLILTLSKSLITYDAEL